jgi:hypothetical protein
MKACPFCGSKDICYVPFHGYWAVVCECGCNGPLEPNISDAQRSWGKRTKQRVINSMFQSLFGVKLNSCMFCGHEHTYGLSDYRGDHIQCAHCSAAGPRGNKMTEAAKKWNVISDEESYQESIDSDTDSGVEFVPCEG